jgi:hypothetical protein
MKSLDCDCREAALRDGRLVELGDAAPGPAGSVAISRALWDTVVSDPEAMAWIIRAGFRDFALDGGSAVPCSFTFHFTFHPRTGGDRSVVVRVLFEGVPPGGIAATYFVAGESFASGPAVGSSGVM